MESVKDTLVGSRARQVCGYVMANGYVMAK
jgi:hypothetical protein